jgi:hypothetical protein
MTRAEIYDELIASGVDFDHRARKAELQEIYDKLHVHKRLDEPPPMPKTDQETEEERLIREADADVEPELDEDGNPIDPELGGEGEDEEEKSADEFNELLDEFNEVFGI